MRKEVHMGKSNISLWEGEPKARWQQLKGLAQGPGVGVRSRDGAGPPSGSESRDDAGTPSGGEVQRLRRSPEWG